MAKLDRLGGGADRGTLQRRSPEVETPKLARGRGRAIFDAKSVAAYFVDGLDLLPKARYMGVIALRDMALYDFMRLLPRYCGARVYWLPRPGIIIHD